MTEFILPLPALVSCQPVLASLRSETIKPLHPQGSLLLKGTGYFV